jgi:inward rectifier potassium channel
MKIPKLSKSVSRKKRIQPKSQFIFITKLQQLKNQFLAKLDHPLQDFYHWLLVISWTKFLLLISSLFLFVNVIFGFAYLTTGNGIANAKPGSFSDVFFFSVQTISTIGYGAMYPQTIYAQIIVTAEVLVGLLSLTTATGLVFARFAKPKARVLFSKVAVICPFNGVPTFMFRVANQRDNRIIEAHLEISILKNEISPEGHSLRRLYDLQLLRSQSPSFQLTWLVMHPIDEASPFYGETAESLAESDTQLLIILTGIDETFSQTIHARYTYFTQDILWSRRFVDILHKTTNGRYVIDYGSFHDVIPLDA